MHKLIKFYKIFFICIQQNKNQPAVTPKNIPHKKFLKKQPLLLSLLFIIVTSISNLMCNNILSEFL